MYVIRYTNNGSSGSHANTAPGTTRYFPADRCTWVQRDEPGTSNYEIFSVFYHDGFSAAEELASGTTELGYIGKSGRFVGITV